MTLVVESTDKFVTINGVQARVWEGATDFGVPVILFVTRIAVSTEASPTDLARFQSELTECRPPSPEAAAFPRRMVL